MDDGINEQSEGFPLIDAIDHEILMHREAHFGGQFPVMLEYYQKEGKGISPDFTIERIEELAKLESGLQQNLAAIYLSGSEAERIADVKEAYKGLRDIYNVKKPKSPYPRLIADLILSEEEEPVKEIQAIVEEKHSIVPLLIDLLRNEDFHDPLFPGYGLGPSLVAKCLGLIGDKRAIISLFEAIGQGDFFEDEQVLKALKEIGDPAKQFLLKVVSGHPINEDNEKAAIGLIQFKDDPEVSKTCFNLLKDPAILKDPCLPTYLVLVCEGLPVGPERDAFIQMSNQNVSKQLKEDMKAIIHGWKI